MNRRTQTSLVKAAAIAAGIGVVLLVSWLAKRKAR